MELLVLSPCFRKTLQREVPGKMSRTVRHKMWKQKSVFVENSPLDFLPVTTPSRPDLKGTQEQWEVLPLSNEKTLKIFLT